ncbi:MAG: cyclic nucleotide-binding domain-containing protein, partial [Deltaproteobacteria bacterium]|nr:cyclic nucleotide-binding domain-containing protein [Deltaproteobacteria bacterium]
MELPENSYSVVPPAICKFLSQCRPFSELSQETLEDLSRQCLVACFPKGTLIFKQGDTEIDHVHLIQTGGVRVCMVTGDTVVTLKEYGEQGESFGGSSIVNNRMAEFDVEAMEDTFCLLIPKDSFLSLVKQTPQLAEHFEEAISETVLGAAYAEQRTQKVGARSEKSLYLFSTRVSDIVSESHEIVEASASVQEVAMLMTRRAVASVLVRDPGGDTLGIVTNQELKSRVVAAGLDYNTPVERIMVSPVRTVPALAYCFEALLTMIQAQVDHLAVQHREEIVGVINAKDMLGH